MKKFLNKLINVFRINQNFILILKSFILIQKIETIYKKHLIDESKIIKDFVKKYFKIEK